VSRGLAAAGYTSVNLDAGVWLPDRDAQGRLQPNSSKFPDLAALGARLNAQGLGLGLYTDLTEGSCGAGPGSGGHWAEDARRFAIDFGATYLKVDFCGKPNWQAAGQLARWQEVRDALNATGKGVYLSACPRTASPDAGSAPFADGFVYAPPLNWTAQERIGAANGLLVEYVNTVDAWYFGNESGCHMARHPCGIPATSTPSRRSPARSSPPPGPLRTRTCCRCASSGRRGTPG